MASRGGRGGRGGGYGPTPDRGRGRGGPSRGGYDGGGRGGRGGRGGGGAGSGGAQVFSNPDNSPLQPDPKVKKIEDEFEANLSSTDTLGLQKLSIARPLPVRPGYGSKGDPVVLYTNHFEFIPPLNLNLYRSPIIITPKADRARIRYRIVQLLLEHQLLAPQRQDIVTDFQAYIVACKKLNYDGQEISIPFKHEGEDEPTEGAQVYKVRLGAPELLRVSDLVNYISSTDVSSAFDKGPILQALNIWLGHHAKTDPGVVSVGGGKCVSLSAPHVDLGAGLILWRGFFSSIRIATARILANVNVKHRVFWEPLPLNQLFLKYAPSVKFDRFKLQRGFKSVRVKTTHLPQKKNKKGQAIERIKTITGFANTLDGRKLAHPPRVPSFGAGPKQVEFYLEAKPGGPKGKENVKAGSAQGQTGKYISVADHFKKTYNIVTEPKLPVVNVGNKEFPSYLPVEVCVVLQGQNANVVLPPEQTAKMITFAVRKPAQNANSIVNDGVRDVGLSKDVNRHMGTFGINVPRRLVTVNGRVLKPPSIEYKQPPAITPEGGSWNLRNVKFNTGASLRNWSAVVIARKDKGDQRVAFQNKDQLDNTLKEFHRSFARVGMTCDPPKRISRIDIQGPDDPQIDQELRSVPGGPNELKFVLFIFPESDIPLWQKINDKADLKYGVLTGKVVGHKFAKNQPQYFANLQLKYNLKCGGINQKLPRGRLGLIEENKTMLVGADVTHPAPTSSGDAPSIAGIVGSIDPFLGQFLPVVRVQERRAEMIEKMDEMLKVCLDRWTNPRFGKHANLPENIILYRDGVSEGQFQLVLDEELSRMKKACQQKYPAASTKAGFPRFTIIIVGKRHNLRLYPSTVETSANGNPKNGTVVDRSITEAPTWEFLLQAHHALQGTARPAKYTVIHDEIFRRRPIPPGFKNHADVVEDLTHSMCYLFGRATKAVSLCPPAYYADILCERARCYIPGLLDNTPAQSVVSGEGGDTMRESFTIHQNLRDTMFYI